MAGARSLCFPLLLLSAGEAQPFLLAPGPLLTPQAAPFEGRGGAEGVTEEAWQGQSLGRVSLPPACPPRPMLASHRKQS